MKFSSLKIWRTFLILVFLSGLIPLASYLGFFSSSSTAIASGMSSFRLVIIFLIAFVQVLALAFLVRSLIFPLRVAANLETLRNRSAPLHRQTIFYLAGFLTLLMGLYAIMLAPEIIEIFARQIFQRILPILYWSVFLISLALLGFSFLHAGLPFRNKFHRSFLLAFGFTLVTFLAWLLIARPYIPELVNRAGWNAIGVPVVEWQLALAWLGGLAIVALIAFIERRVMRKPPNARNFPRWFDILIATLFWFTAVISWQSIEITPSWFVSTRLPPNREFYPLSDARLYDTVAQDALDGVGFRFDRTPYVRRPLHGLYLLALHTVAGQSYEKLVFIQILILGFLPVLMYFLGKSFHNRLSGGISALLLILREANSIALAGTITAAHAKVLLADLLTTLLVMLVVYVAFHWFKSIETSHFGGLGLGGILGLAMLTRLETSVFIVVFLLLLMVVLLPKRKFRPFAFQATGFLIGIVLIISPWVLRNWIRTGQVFIDSPSHRQSLILQRFILWKENPPQIAPPATQTDLPMPTIKSPLKPATSLYPTPVVPVQAPSIPDLTLDPQSLGGLATYFAVHFLNSQIQAFLILPSTFRGLDSLVSLAGHRSLSRFFDDCCSLKDYVRRLPFWHRWLGEFPRQTLLPIVINALAIAYGVSLMWRRQRWLGLMPALLWLSYLFAHAVFRNSGGRYVLPVDWISIFYFSISLAYGTLFLHSVLFKGRVSAQPMAPGFELEPAILPQAAGVRVPALSIFLICLLISVSIPVTESLLPARYTPEVEKQMLDTLLDSPELTEHRRQEILATLEGGSQARVGRALYPQLFRTGYGAPGYEYGPLSAQDYPRLVFFLTGKSSSDLALPVEERVGSIPDGSDALVILCPSEFPEFPQVLAAAFFNPSGRLEKLLYRSSDAGEYSCP